MRNIMYKVRAFTAHDVITNLIEMSKICGRSLDEIYIDNQDMLTLLETTLTDDSKVYDVQVSYVGPDYACPIGN